MIDTIELYHVKSGRRPGWRFRMTNGYHSEGSYESRDECKRVARRFNELCYGGEFQFKRGRWTA